MKKPIAIALCSLPLAWMTVAHAEGGDTLNPDLQGSPSTTQGATPVPESSAPGTVRPATRDGGTATDGMQQGTDQNRVPNATQRRDDEMGRMDSPADRNPNPESPINREGLSSNSTSTDSPPNVPRTAQ